MDRIAALRKQSAEKLRREAEKLSARFTNLRYQLAQGKVKNVRELRLVRKQRARILTILRERDNRDIQENHEASSQRAR